MPGAWSPAIVALAVQFGLQMSFMKAAELFNKAKGTTLSHDTMRRLTERAGAVWRQVEAMGTTEEAPDPVASARDVLLSLDGATAPLVGGEWAEVRTAVVGTITPTPHGPTATALSYASRLTSAAAFGPSADREWARRGVSEHPGAVVAVTDGAAWIQDLLDERCPGAVRVLDLVHALEYFADAAQAAFGPGTEATSEWIAQRRSDLKAGRCDEALAALAALPASEARETARRDLGVRRAMLAYDRFQAAGWPIGSGAVESANKLVVEARLKGAGMHWQRDHADALVGPRALDASRRGDAVWPRIVAAWRATPRTRRARHDADEPAPEPAIPPPIPPCPAACATPLPAPETLPMPRPKTIVNGKPTAEHPWKRRLLAPRTNAPAASH